MYFHERFSICFVREFLADVTNAWYHFACTDFRSSFKDIRGVHWKCHIDWQSWFESLEIAWHSKSFKTVHGHFFVPIFCCLLNFTQLYMYCKANFGGKLSFTTFSCMGRHFEILRVLSHFSLFFMNFSVVKHKTSFIFELLSTNIALEYFFIMNTRFWDIW